MSSQAGRVTFYILLKNPDSHLVLAMANPNISLVTVFKELREDPDANEYIPKQVTWKHCEFYRLKTPVAMDLEDDPSGDCNAVPDEIEEACLQETNRVRIDPRKTKVKSLADQLSEDYVYLVIHLPDPFLASTQALMNLREQHDLLFYCLKVTVAKLGAWTEEDMKKNLQGGILSEEIEDLPSALGVIQGALSQDRTYKESFLVDLESTSATDIESPPAIDSESTSATDVTAPQRIVRDIEKARCYQREFNIIFKAIASGLPTVITNREFVAFHNVLRCFNKDVDLIAHKDTSSALKASNFVVHFVQPPFFSEIHDDTRGFKYEQEKSWGFPIFVDTENAFNVCRKFTPRSDWMIVSPRHNIPFVISEVISDKTESDRSKMLVEATALARVGQALLEFQEDRFFLVAIYVTADMVVSRYIVMQAEDDKKRKTRKKPDAGKRVELSVFIHRKDFDLRKTNDQIHFLREMYNLASQITVLSRKLDDKKKDNLAKIHKDASKVLSLSSTPQPPTTRGNTTMESIPERGAGSAEPQDEDDLGIFKAQDIQNILHQMNYEIEFIPWGHPHLAVIVHKYDDTHGYLKFVRRDNELRVLRFLSNTQSRTNHTISGVQFWPVQGGTVISMPVAGGWLTSLRNPDEHLLSVALQLAEGVAFMHGHNIAHMDIKPQNVIIPLEGGRLSIIDFSVSIFVDNASTRYNNVVGTERYIAPEVYKGLYKPMLADLWSCGRTLEELCSCCNPSAERTRVLEIARKLMSRDPEARPSMATVVGWLDPQRRAPAIVAPPVVLPPGQAPSVTALCA